MNTANSSSQFGEDLMVMTHFQGRSDLTFVEVGAYLPDALSQTYQLEKAGWTGLLVEPQPHLCEQLRRVRTAKVFEVACGSPMDHGSKLRFELNASLSRLLKADEQTTHPVMEVPVMTLNSILESSGVETINFLSIDTEGFELAVMQGLDFEKYKPELVVIEDHFESLEKDRFLRSKGYKAVKRVGCNNWYIPRGSSIPTPLKYKFYFPLRRVKATLGI
jgi:FkbM family methyltransferase